MKLLKSYTYTEKHSKFIVLLYEATTSDEVKEILKGLKEEHKKATHILRVSRVYNQYQVKITEASEDKEPISSMKKTAALMEKKDIVGKALFIIRYFGGTKFGASYLDKVYFSLALEALGLKGSGE